MKLFTTLTAAALLIGGLLNAQPSGDRITVRFATPVVIGETTLPAGECDIQVMRGSSDNVVLIIRSKEGPYASALASHVWDSTAENTSSASVVLDRRGSSYRLNRVLFADHTGFQLQNVD